MPGELARIGVKAGCTLTRDGTCMIPSPLLVSTKFGDLPLLTAMPAPGDTFLSLVGGDQEGIRADPRRRRNLRSAVTVATEQRPDLAHSMHEADNFFPFFLSS